ncbi:MAG: hypothetical protein JNK38_27430 [Acidobacteria bacterium]|nr:hypothetical protein [Acidobacteriota bacterium]
MLETALYRRPLDTARREKTKACERKIAAFTGFLFCNAEGGTPTGSGDLLATLHLFKLSPC